MASLGIAGRTGAQWALSSGRGTERRPGHQGAGISLLPMPSPLRTLWVSRCSAVWVAVRRGGVRRPDGSWIRKRTPSVCDASLGSHVADSSSNDLPHILASTLDPSSVRFVASLQNPSKCSPMVYDESCSRTESSIDGCAWSARTNRVCCDQGSCARPV